MEKEKKNPSVIKDNKYSGILASLKPKELGVKRIAVCAKPAPEVIFLQKYMRKNTRPTEGGQDIPKSRTQTEKQ